LVKEENMTDLETRFVGSMAGSALGDAIGELAFRIPDEARLRERIDATEEFVYTDDTAMAIGLAQSLLARRQIDPQHLGDTFRANYQREPWRGYASGPPSLFRLVDRQEITYVEAAQGLFGGQGSYGNGAAMRIAPLGLYYHAAPDLYDQARASAAVTHAHPIGIDGAAVQARAVAQAVTLDLDECFDPQAFLRGLRDMARTPEMQGKLAQVSELVAANVPANQVARELGQGVAVHRSLPFALYAFLRHPRSFEDCLFCAILNGGDRDTLGAMACAVSGAYLGAEAIPPGWRQRLENRELITGLARRLAAAAGN
jgi:poly(ADP-ribose) glycohydrolase ARH3